MTSRSGESGRGRRARDAASGEQVVDASAVLPAFFVHDAAYLELAIRRSATLVTRDERLATAARAARHPVRWRRPRR